MLHPLLPLAPAIQRITENRPILQYLRRSVDLQ
jgi:hypothetical protein